MKRSNVAKKLETLINFTNMEQVPDTFPELFFAYLAVWIIFFLYLAYLGSKVRSLQKRLEKDI